jgi:hypothetical protein
MASVVWEVVTSQGFFKIFIASQSSGGELTSGILLCHINITDSRSVIP